MRSRSGSEDFKEIFGGETKRLQSICPSPEDLFIAQNFLHRLSASTGRWCGSAHWMRVWAILDGSASVHTLYCMHKNEKVSHAASESVDGAMPIRSKSFRGT